MTGRKSICAILLAVLSCATIPNGERARAVYQFPKAFRANQTVRVRLAKAETLEFLASVRRKGEDYEVTLFDPLFATPLLAVSSHDGAVAEELVAPGIEAGWGIRLLNLLREIYGETYLSQANDAWDAPGRAARYTLSNMAGGGDTCVFPKTIEASPRAGVLLEVSAHTLQVDCSLRSVGP